jgi:hypothetical protein
MKVEKGKITVQGPTTTAQKLPSGAASGKEAGF